MSKVAELQVKDLFAFDTVRKKPVSTHYTGVISTGALDKLHVLKAASYFLGPSVVSDIGLQLWY